MNKEHATVQNGRGMVRKLCTHSCTYNPPKNTRAVFPRARQVTSSAKCATAPCLGAISEAYRSSLSYSAFSFCVSRSVSTRSAALSPLRFPRGEVKGDDKLVPLVAMAPCGDIRGSLDLSPRAYRV